jgi:hypothetical protein
MKKLNKIGLALTLLGVATVATAASAADLTRCNSGSIVAVTDSQSCNVQTLSYANTAGNNFVRANLVRIASSVGFGIENVGRDANRAVIQGCIAGVNGGGTNTDSTCGGLVRFHEFRIRR